MFSEQVTSIFAQEEFEKISANLNLGTVIGDDKFVYDSATRTLHVKKVQTAISAGFRYPIENVFNGDIIEIEFEYKYISGTQASFLLYGNHMAFSTMQPTTPMGEWEKIKVTFVSPIDFIGYDYNSYLEFGAYSAAGTGEYFLRNLSFKIKSRKNRVFIIDSGENENGHWIKYSDGYMECWGSKTFASVPITTASGSVFYAPNNTTPLGDFPIGFAEMPTFNISCYCTNNYALVTAVTVPTITTMPQINTFRFTSATTDVSYNWSARGKWRIEPYWKLS